MILTFRIHLFILISIFMSDEHFLSNSIPLTLRKSRRIRIIKNLIYLIILLDFLLHCILTIELNVVEQIYRTLEKANSTAIPLCQLPIKQYLAFSLSDMSLYILYCSILALFISIEAIRKFSFSLYRFYMMMKFIFAISSLSLCTIYTIIDRQMSFISSSLTIPHENTPPISITIDPCLTYTREKMAIYIFSIVNVFAFLLSIECAKVFSLVKIKVIQI